MDPSGRNLENESGGTAGGRERWDKTCQSVFTIFVAKR